MNTVDGVSQLEVEMIHNTLSKMYSPIYADIWKIGVNLSLRIGDLLQLKYEDLNVTERSVKLTEAKTGKAKQIRLNNAALAVITRRRHEYPGLFYQKNGLFHDTLESLGISDLQPKYLFQLYQ